jgi:molecular chaperone GrpE
MPRKKKEEFDDIQLEEEITDSFDSKLQSKEKKLKKQIKELKEESKTNLDGWQRSRAEYANLQKEFEEERKRLKGWGIIEVVSEIIPALDSFEIAMKDKDSWNEVPENWRVGVEYIYQQFVSRLSGLGVEKIDKTGIEVNHHLHDPTETREVEDEKADMVIEIIQPGYKYKEEIIRPAQVVVGVKKEK